MELSLFSWTELLLSLYEFAFAAQDPSSDQEHDFQPLSAPSKTVSSIQQRTMSSSFTTSDSTAFDLVVSGVSEWISEAFRLAISFAHVVAERGSAFKTDVEARLSATFSSFSSPNATMITKKKQQLELEIEWLEREKQDLVAENELLKTQQLAIAQEFWTTSFECTSPGAICVDYASDEYKPTLTALLAEKEQQLFKLEVEKRELYDSVIRYAHELQASVQQYEADIEQLNRNADQLEDVAQQLLDKATGLQMKLSDSKARELLAFNFIRAHLLPVASVSHHHHEPRAQTPTESEDSEVECCEF